MSHTSRPKMTSIMISFFFYCLALLSYQNLKLSSSKSFFCFVLSTQTKPASPFIIHRPSSRTLFFFSTFESPFFQQLKFPYAVSLIFLFCHYKTHTNTNYSFLMAAPPKTTKSIAFNHHWNSSSHLSNPIDQCQHLHQDNTASLLPTTRGGARGWQAGAQAPAKHFKSSYYLIFLIEINKLFNNKYYYINFGHPRKRCLAPPLPTTTTGSSHLHPFPTLLSLLLHQPPWTTVKENESVIDSLSILYCWSKNNVYTDYIQDDPLYQERFSATILQRNIQSTAHAYLLIS